MATLPRFDFERVPQLPPLAWVATVSPDLIVRVLHGAFVETRDGFFVEGAWSGPFEAGGLAECDSVFGSGVSICGGRVTFVSSTATTDYLFHASRSGAHVVSNSLPVLLWFIGDRLDPGCRKYHTINRSIADGIRLYQRRLPTVNAWVERVIHANLVCDGSTLSAVDKPLPPRFCGFAEYRDFLTERYASLAANARDPARARPMRIYSTQSKGYDSTAVNAIAKGAGLDAVFTIPKGKGPNTCGAWDAATETDDDGTEISGALGLASLSVDRRAFERGIPHEAAYWSALDCNDDFNFVGLTQGLKNPSLLLTGTHGDMVWGASGSKEGHPISNDLLRGDLGGHALSEVRLRLGYVQAAVPFLGARRHTDIAAISASPEMAAWCIGGDYDRPIPRRIAEEAGVPRLLFGRIKRASAVNLPLPPRPFGAELGEEFKRFLLSNRVVRHVQVRLWPLVQRYNAFIHYNSPRYNLAGYYAGRVVWHLTRGTRELPRAWQRYQGSIFCFAVNREVSHLSKALPRPAIRPS